MRMERCHGILQMTFHMHGGPLPWGELPQRGFPQAFQEIGSDPDTRVMIMTGTGTARGSGRGGQAMARIGVAFSGGLAPGESVEIIRALLRDGVVSYRGNTVAIERFDLRFTQMSPHIPIYVGALFPTMLQVCGEIAEGTILTWSTLEAGRLAAEHLAIGARRAGRRPEEIDIASLLPCYVGDNRQQALDAMRGAIGFYGGFFPRYNRRIAESGFPEAASAIKAAWLQGGREAAARVVPDALIEAIAVAGTPAECRARVEAYRRAGIMLPIISPRVGGPDAKHGVMEAIRACAP